MLKLWTTAEVDYLRRTVEPIVRSIPQPRPKARGVTYLPYELAVPDEGEVVLAMGKDCVDKLKQSSLVPKGLSIGKMRGKLWPAGVGQGHWMVTYDPYMIELEPQMVVDIQWDVRLAMRWLMHQRLEPIVGDYRYVDSFAGAIQRVKEKFKETGKPVHVSEDLETLGLYPWYENVWIISIAFTVDHGYSDVMVFPKQGQLPTKKQLQEVRWLESSDMVSLGGSGLKYDNVWKREKWGLPSPPRFKFDNLLGGGLLNENVRQSLNVQTKMYTDLGGYDDSFNDKHDKARMDVAYEADPDGYLLYAGGDTDASARVRPTLAQGIRDDPALLDFYTTILHPAAVAFESVEYRGIEVDAGKLKAVGGMCERRMQECLHEMNGALPYRLRLKHAERLKYTPKVLQEIFFTGSGWGLKPKVFTKKSPKERDETPTAFMRRMEERGEDWVKWASTSIDDHLKVFLDHPDAGPFLKAKRSYSKAEKIRSSYVDGFLKHRRPDGKFHPTYGLYVGSLFESFKLGDADTAGANTGRTSAKGPHVQTIPKQLKPGDDDWVHPLRDCYVAPKGKRWFSVDVEQGELKICACLADERTMIEAYLAGQDLHLKTGAQLNDLSYEEGAALKVDDETRYKAIRYGAKAANFGKIFDQSPEGFVDYCFQQWNLVISLKESERIDEEFFGLYTGLRPWHSRQRSKAHRDGFVRNPLGRIRHLPMINSKDRRVKSKARRQSINSPVQSTLSDLMLWAIAIAELETDLPQRGLEINLFTHDDISGYVPEGPEGVLLVRQLMWIMENLPIEDCFEWRPQLKFTVSAEMGPTLGRMKEVKLEPLALAA